MVGNTGPGESGFARVAGFAKLCRRKPCAKRGWNIRANSVHPAFVRTALLDGCVGDRDRDGVLDKMARRIPTGRMSEVEDVVRAVIYLASDDSSMMTASERWSLGNVSL